MKTLALSLLLAAVWAALVGAVDTPHLVVGFVIGYGVLWFLRPWLSGSYHRKLPLLIGFLAFFLKELVQSTLRVAWEVLTPSRKRRPGIIAVPLEAKTDFEITVLANLLTMTPGTLSLDVSDDRRELYVHAMFVEDPDELRRQIKDELERRVLALLRDEPPSEETR